MNNIRRIVAVCALTASMGCVYAQSPDRAPRQADIQSPEPTYQDLDYAPAIPADSVGHKLDIYLPEGVGGAMPVVVWTRGSAWLGDNGKGRIGTLPTVFNDAGYVVVGASVRSSSQAVFPAQIHDLKAAIRWLRANADTYHIDPDRIGVFGTSSAGWGAAMAAVTSNAPGLEGDVGVTGPSSAVQAAIAFYPPTDFLQMDLWSPLVCTEGEPFGCHNGPGSPESLLLGCQITTCPDKVREANPVAYADREDPPLMILHGLSDSTVPAHQGQLLYQTLSKACAEVVFIALPMAGHDNNERMVTDPELQAGSFMLSTSSQDCAATPPEFITPTWQTLIGFFDEHLKN